MMARELVEETLIAAEPERVFAAWTQAEQMTVFSWSARSHFLPPALMGFTAQVTTTQPIRLW